MLSHMRTTLRIDDDLMRQLKDRARREEVSLNRLVNDTLRSSLANPPAQPKKKKFVQRTRPMGRPLIDLTKASAFAAQLEDEEIIRKMSLGK